MKAHYKTSRGNLTFEIEGPNVKTLFRAIGEIQAAFEVENVCGMCQSRIVFFRVRTVDGNDYYSLQCQECRSELKFGQLKKGDGLFIKRTGPKDNNGWVEWKTARETDTPAEPEPPTPFDQDNARRRNARL